MQLIFNDASSIPVQKVTLEGGYLKILTLESPETFKPYFSDPFKTRKMTVQERGRTVDEHEGYTKLYEIAWSPGDIYTVVMYKAETLPQVQAEEQAAAVLVARIQAQSLPDGQALTVKALYKDWERDPEGYPYKMRNPDDKRRNYDGKLWNLNKDHNKQADWYPGKDPTLWTEIVEGHAGTKEDPIPVPDSVTTSGFEYEYGKYYSEGETVYLCKRGGIEDPESMYGEKEKLYFPPSAMIGQYFEVVTE